MLSILTAILTQRLQSIWMAMICALFYTLCGAAGHNYLHQRDNFRMKYFNLLFMTYRGWRVSHALSHHMFPNSRLDFEMVMFEPYFIWDVTKDKNFIQRYVSYVYAPIYYCIFYPAKFFIV